MRSSHKAHRRLNFCRLQTDTSGSHELSKISVTAFVTPTHQEHTSCRVPATAMSACHGMSQPAVCKLRTNSSAHRSRAPGNATTRPQIEVLMTSKAYQFDLLQAIPSDSFG